MSSRLENFLDELGRVKQWPSKRGVQIELIRYIANKFADGSKYTESEINNELKKLHTFQDWALLRRELCVLGYFSRDINGHAYVRTDKR